MKCLISSPLFRQYFVVFIVNISIFTTGISLAWPSPILVKLNDPDQTPLSRPISEEEGSWIVSVGFLFAAFTDIIFSKLLDRIGRRYCLILLFIPKLLMGLLFTFATEFWMLILGRLIMTTADCYSLVVVPVYASELSSKEHRGVLGTLLQVLASSGELVTLSVGPYVSYKTFNIIFTAIIAIAVIPTILFLPDSPSFLYSKDRRDEALKVLTHLRGDEVKATKEIEEYDLSNQNYDKVKIISFFKDKVYRKSLGLATLIAVGTQLIGFNAVTFYLQTIFISTNTSLGSEISSVIIGVIQMISSILTHVVISSRFNRKTILTVSLGAMCAGMVGLGAFFQVTMSEGYIITGFINYLPLICVIVVTSSYICGIGSLAWLVLGELFDERIRAFGVSFSLTWTTVLLFLTSKYFPIVTTSLGAPATYWIFSGFNVVLITLIVLFLPETKGKSFGEIQKALGRKTEEDQKNVENNS